MHRLPNYKIPTKSIKSCHTWASARHTLTLTCNRFYHHWHSWWLRIWEKNSLASYLLVFAIVVLTNMFLKLSALCNLKRMRIDLCATSCLISIFPVSWLESLSRKVTLFWMILDLVIASLVIFLHEISLKIYHKLTATIWNMNLENASNSISLNPKPTP